MKYRIIGKSELNLKPFLPLIIAMMILLMVNSCKKDDPDEGGWKTANSGCVTASCH